VPAIARRRTKEFLVRILLVVMVTLAAAGWAACHVEPTHLGFVSQPTATKPFGWRRTAEGWEKSENWWKTEIHPSPSAGSRLSPLSLAAMEAALSLAALAALSRPEKKIFEKSAC
jgi:hypothetical protein